jgi:hypothetical protein
MHSGFAAAVLILLGLSAGVRAVADTGVQDAVFDRVPFDRWSAEGNQSSLPWTIEFDAPELSSHQRLFAGVRITVEGRKLAKHGLQKQLLALVQFEGSDGRIWRTHSSLKRGASGDISFIQNAFVLPGDYVVAVAICDAAGLQHSFARKKMHVSPLKADPLSGSWEGSPDTWFLPEIGSRLQLPVQTRHPVHIDVLLNTTPADRPSDRIGEMRRNMSALIPPLKVISQMNLTSGSMDLAFLDLAGRKETAVRNWDDMKVFFTASNPAIIDVKALDGRWKMTNFFLERVTQRIEAQHVVIVLSGPAFFEDQEEMETLALPQGLTPRVFYIRCRFIPLSVREPRPRPRPGVRPRPPQRFAFALPLDDLERPLDSPGARIFDVISAEQFRRVLAGVMGQIAKL